MNLIAVRHSISMVVKPVSNVSCIMKRKTIHKTVITPQQDIKLMLEKSNLLLI
jgi:hypothetical protein